MRDAEKGLKIAQILEGFISRKVVKQTVMTVVYGVTRYGGRLQIEKRLKEIDEFPKVRGVSVSMSVCGGGGGGGGGGGRCMWGCSSLLLCSVQFYF